MEDVRMCTCRSTSKWLKERQWRDEWHLYLIEAMRGLRIYIMEINACNATQSASQPSSCRFMNTSKQPRTQKFMEVGGAGKKQVRGIDK